MNRTRLIATISLCIGALLVGRWFYYINEYSVNLMFWDQWDFYKPLFDDGSLWQQFNYQHGPHKQGIGMWLTSFIADVSAWNTRAETFTIGVLIFSATLLTLRLKFRLFNKIESSDVILLMIGLTPAQYALFSATPNISHGSMPFLLLVLYCLSWLIKGNIKYLWVCLFNFLLIYTGFGIFVGLITPVLLVLELIRRRSPYSKKWIAGLFLGVSLLSLVLFFSDYATNKHSSQLMGEQFVRGMDYMLFIFQSISNYWSFKAINLWTHILGGLSFLVLLFLVFKSLHKLWKQPSDPKYRTIFILASFTALFLVGAALARTSGGIAGSKASRYAIYISPGFIACYLYFKTVFKRQWLHFLLFAFLLLPALNVKHAQSEMQTMKARKLQWKQVYLETENIEVANTQTNFRVFPKKKQELLNERLTFLKEEKLNLFKGSK